MSENGLKWIGSQARFVSLVASVFPEEEITEESSMFDTDSWDSLGHMQVIIALKEQMSLNCRRLHIAEATSIESIVSIIDEVLMILRSLLDDGGHGSVI